MAAAWLAFTTPAVPAVQRVLSNPAPTASEMRTYCADQDSEFRDRIPFVGMSDSFVELASLHSRDCSFGLMAANHLGYYRAVLNWSGVELRPGRYDFTFYDRLVAQLAQHHMRLLPVLLGPPAWESSAPRSATSTSYPPAHQAPFGRFAALCVKRYGPGGSFWRDHPDLPYYPVRAWQIWNEPNLQAYWPPKPNAAAYVRLLRASYVAIKRVDPHAIVVTAGMAALSATEEPSWLNALYRAGLHGAFDALAIHLYGPTPGWALNRLKTARGIMDRFGDRHEALWVTEVGWTGGPPDAYAPSQRGQRVQVSRFMGLVERNRARLGLKQLIWYGWQDKVYGPDPDWWGYHLGFFTAGLRPKLALRTFAAAARRLDQ